MQAVSDTPCGQGRWVRIQELTGHLSRTADGCTWGRVRSWLLPLLPPQGVRLGGYGLHRRVDNKRTTWYRWGGCGAGWWGTVNGRTTWHR